ncbi:MAG: 1-acyl-sn-glycerol-3-phosphate acyltransferase [Holosporaceae bacterium]|jgi:1-acyl-sn-glycerol-3-phosphate acyltransferase|nr:1-acyl-sn-glycerol-3-phosphate acyltransferase [Holosporaceae bacterium]
MQIIRSALFNIIFFSTITVIVILGYPLVFFNNPKYIFAFWHYLSIILKFIIAKIGGINDIVENEKNILQEPAIYAIRHESVWETLILINRFKEPIFLLKEELLRIPIFGALAKKAGAIAIDRNNGVKSLKEIVEQVKVSISQRHPVIIFPEGTRMAFGEFSNLKRGIALIYRKTGCPVVPVIHNSGRFWPRRRFIKRSGTIVVKFLDPIMPGLTNDEFMNKLNCIFSTEIKKMETS